MRLAGDDHAVGRAPPSPASPRSRVRTGAAGRRSGTATGTRCPRPDRLARRDDAACRARWLYFAGRPSTVTLRDRGRAGRGQPVEVARAATASSAARPSSWLPSTCSRGRGRSGVTSYAASPCPGTYGSSARSPRQRHGVGLGASSTQGPIGLPIQRVLSGTDSPRITSDTGPTVACLPSAAAGQDHAVRAEGGARARGRPVHAHHPIMEQVGLHDAAPVDRHAVAAARPGRPRAASRSRTTRPARSWRPASAARR